MSTDPNEGANCASERKPTRRSLLGLDWTNFFLADVQTGVGPFLAIYLTSMPNLGWNQETTGLVLTVGGIAGIIAQTPAGALVDRLQCKRTLIAIGIFCLALSSLVIALAPHFWPVIAAQITIGSTSSVFIPAIAAITLGLVGHSAFDRRQGRNQMFNSGGNVAAAIAMGLLGYFVSNRSIFGFVAAMIIPTFFFLRKIDPSEIDNELARGYGENGGKEAKASTIGELFSDKRLIIFLISAVGFHFANAAMLPLLGELLGTDKGRSSMLFMTACVVTTQLVMTLFASRVGRLASSWGRKPLLLTGFAVLPVRGLLYTLTHNAALLVSIQILDGIGAVVFGVVSVLVVADLTKGTGRFNFAQGAIATAVGIGASLSQVSAGTIAHHFGYNAAFLFLAAIAACAFLLFLFCMPETVSGREESNSG